MIKLSNLSFNYDNVEDKILKNINLDIKKGEAVLVCGKSGSGKSTLLQVVNGIIDELKEGTLTGEVILDGKDARKMKVNEKSLMIGSIYQNPKNQFFHLNTTDELYFGVCNQLVPIEEIKKRADNIITTFDLKDFTNRNIFNLSGGEKQRIACASVAMSLPKIMVIDEPSSNLDHDSIIKLKDILKKLKENGVTILIAEHRLFYALEVVDRVIYMNDGEIKNDYTTQEFLKLDSSIRKSMGLRSFIKEEIKNINNNDLINPLIIQNLKVKYGKYQALNLDSIEIPTNDIVAIIGRNGAGKSSFVKGFTGLIKTKGAKINNQKLNPKKQQKDSFMVMQDVNTQLYLESVLDELIQLTSESDEIIDKAKDTLAKLDLLKYQDYHPLILSGGQKQRLAIATALFLNKKYLIFDEPTSGLDYENMIRVSNLLKELKSQVEAIIVITHDYEFINNLDCKVIDFDYIKEK